MPLFSRKNKKNSLDSKEIISIYDFNSTERAECDRVSRAAWEKVLKDILNIDPRLLRGVEIHAADDCCPYCRKFKNKVFDFKNIPVLPHSGCTHKMGCRCTIYPMYKNKYTR